MSKGQNCNPNLVLDEGLKDLKNNFKSRLPTDRHVILWFCTVFCVLPFNINPKRVYVAFRATHYATFVKLQPGTCTLFELLSVLC